MDENFQLQELLLPPISVLQQDREKAERDELERYIGIKHHFPDPFHIYLHVNDLGLDDEDPLPVVRFIIYSMGKKKVMMAGTYRRYAVGRVPPFHISYACRYNTRELMRYVSEWNETFTNTLNVMKNRINTRINELIGTPPIPYLRNRKDYIQLKAWLSLQPLSLYYQPNKDPIRIRSLISPEYIKILYSSLRELDIIRPLENEMFLSDLTGDDDSSLREDVNQLRASMIQRLDGNLSKYENEISIFSKYTKNNEVIEISQKLVTWLQTSEYTSDTVVNSLEPCVCNEPQDTGCNILSWGENNNPYDLR